MPYQQMAHWCFESQEHSDKMCRKIICECGWVVSGWTYHTGTHYKTKRHEKTKYQKELTNYIPRDIVENIITGYISSTNINDKFGNYTNLKTAI